MDIRQIVEQTLVQPMRQQAAEARIAELERQLAQVTAQWETLASTNLTDQCVNLAESFLESDPDNAHISTWKSAGRLAAKFKEVAEEFIKHEIDNYDPTPYCSYGHRSAASCDCGPIASNE
jgi:hypothetical protein